MLGNNPSQTRRGHWRSDSEDPDRTHPHAAGDDGRAGEKKISSSDMFSSKSHRKTVNPAHQSLMKLFKSKSRYHGLMLTSLYFYIQT